MAFMQSRDYKNLADQGEKFINLKYDEKKLLEKDQKYC